jgi:hypothetical protein
MKVYEPGTLPPEYAKEWPPDLWSRTATCHTAVAEDGAMLYVVYPEHVYVMGFINSGKAASIALRPYIRANIPIYFIGHTDHVNEWARKFFEPVGTLYQYTRKPNEPSKVSF